MKILYVSLPLLLLTSCTQLGNRIAYGSKPPITPPQSIPQAVDQAIQIKRQVDQVNREINQEKQQENEASQEKELAQVRYVELRNNYLNLREEVVVLKSSNDALIKQSVQLASQLATNNRQLESVQATNRLLSDAVSSLTSRLNTLELAPKKSSPQTGMAQPVETVHLGEMAVIGDQSVHRSQNGSVSIRRGNTHTTYTPRAAPVRRAQQVYHLGPRGGCFYYTNSGRKEYVDRSLCH